jgi:hypothetical protein
MASYIDNIAQNSQIAAVLPYTPDWDFLSSSQKTLTQMQTTAFESFYDKYSTLLKADLLNPENQEFRDKFMIEADSKLKAVGGTDLTDPRNLKNANSLFDNLVNNPRYIKDIMFTKGVKKDLEYADNLRSSLDENVRSLYNPYSVQDIMFSVEDFKNAQGDAMLTVGSPRYVQNLNLWSQAEKYFEDKDWKRTYDQKSGGYIYTSKNGKLIEDDVYQYLHGRFSEDPLVKDFLNVKSRVERRNFVESNLDAFGGDKTKAELAYLKTKWNTISEPIRKQVAKYDEELAKLEYGNAEVERARQNQPATGNVQRQEDQQSIVDLFNDLMTKKESMPTLDPEIDEALSNNDFSNIANLISKIDDIGFKAGVAEIAGVFSRRGEELSMKADEFALVSHRATLDDWKNQQQVARQFEADVRMAQLKGEIVIPGMGGAQGGTPISAGTVGVLEGEDSQKYSEYNQKELIRRTEDAKKAGHEVIRQWSILTGTPIRNSEGKVIPLDSLNRLTAKEFQSYISKAQVVATRGTRDLDDPNSAVSLRQTIRTYQEKTNTEKGLLRAEQQNLLSAIIDAENNAPNNQEAKEAYTLMREIVNSGIVLQDQVRREFEKRWNAKRDAKLKDAPFFNLGGLEAVVGGATSPAKDNWFKTWWNTEDGGDAWNTWFGGFSFFDPGTYGSNNKEVSYNYQQNAKSLYSLVNGRETTVGGEERKGTNFGMASSKGSSVNIVVNQANQSVSQNMGDVGFGTLQTALAGNLPNQDAAQVALNTIVNVLNTKTTGNTNARNMQVEGYEDNEGNQFVRIIPDTKTIDDLIGTKQNPGPLKSKGVTTDQLAEGIVVKLDAAGALPKSTFDFRVTPTEAAINVNGGELTIGGSYYDGGKVTITRNGNGSYQYYGDAYIYDPNKGGYREVNISKEINEYVNANSLTVQQAKDWIDRYLNTNAAKNITLEK